MPRAGFELVVQCLIPASIFSLCHMLTTTYLKHLIYLFLTRWFINVFEKPTTEPCHGPDEFSPHLHTIFGLHFNIIL